MDEDKRKEKQRQNSEGDERGHRTRRKQTVK